MSFELNHICKGITHIRDAMGVCMTLIEGDKAALLWIPATVRRMLLLSYAR